MIRPAKIFYASLFAISMALIESSVVVYLRQIYYPEGFVFPLTPIDQSLLLTEIFREAGTMFLLLSAAFMLSKSFVGRFSWFIICFGIWDIFYYVFLYLLLGWPEHLFVWDVLFLIPTTWVGPVLAPVINSILMISLGLAILYNRKKYGKIRITGMSWLFLIGGSLIILYTYMQDYIDFLLQSFTFAEIFDFRNVNELQTLASSYIPENFSWIIFSTGILLHILVIVVFLTNLRLTNRFCGLFIKK